MQNLSCTKRYSNMEPDIGKILKMKKKEQSDAMLALFQGLLDKDVDQISTAMKGLIEDVDKIASDKEYISLCETNLNLVKGLPEATAEKIISARLKAQSELPENIKSRDSKNLAEALKAVDKDGKIAKIINKINS
ncbi:hypothetical protein [Thermoplasma acidophilum]|uniref:Uncharacterized protein n=2 Tax=Thermoplasma acidophilum TaxID=2303 RepID=Q9HKR4_THEAC|nr:hypothetical protein [Thermoplasma acidophilum]